MAAREDFLGRVAALRHAVSDPAGLTVLQHQPADPARNEAARLFRNGLAVAAFTVLEDFLKSRTAEILSRCSGSSLPFEDLPNALQELGTKRVVKALYQQIGWRERNGEDVSGLIKAAGKALSSTETSAYELSPLLFGQSRQNLGAEDVKELLRAFHIKDGWGNATKLSQRMGFASLSLKDDFQAAARRRHRAAHRASEEVPLGDISALPGQAIAIAASFDALISRAAYLLVRGDKRFAKAGELDSATIPLRFLHQEGQFVREVGENRKRATAKGSDFAHMLVACRKRALSSGAVIVLAENQSLLGWEITDLEPGRP
jgi:hypothetical protein